MPERLAPLFTGVFCAVFSAYACLLASTVFFAAWHSELADSIRDAEASVAVLERDYFARMTAITSADLASHGYTLPKLTRYATIVAGFTLSRADEASEASDASAF